MIISDTFNTSWVWEESMLHSKGVWEPWWSTFYSVTPDKSCLLLIWQILSEDIKPSAVCGWVGGCEVGLIGDTELCSLTTLIYSKKLQRSYSPAITVHTEGTVCSRWLCWYSIHRQQTHPVCITEDMAPGSPHTKQNIFILQAHGKEKKSLHCEMM